MFPGPLYMTPVGYHGLPPRPALRGQSWSSIFISITLEVTVLLGLYILYLTV